MKPRQVVAGLLAKAGIEIDGQHPWDIRIHDSAMFTRVLAQGSIGLGESYMDGQWDCEQLDEFFNRVVAARLSSQIRLTPNVAWLVTKSKVQNRQNKRLARQAADVHYDLPVEIFEATFDQRLTGSCGYWANAHDLDGAQEAKLDLVCRKLGLQPGERVLDIGCGWGAFMGFAAERYGVSCIGVTISKEQVEYGRRRYPHLPIEFRLEDYRDFQGEVDHVASMGMFEHVGPKNYRAYFELVRRVLREDGLFVLHTIWANEPMSHADPWLDKYIFPNGVLPTVGQITTAVHGLFVVEDLHNFRADYDKTLMAWDAKFQKSRAAIAAKHGERFCRMWEYYLRSCAGAFRSREISVGQLVLSPRGVRGGYRTVR
jgi:cyclopropane-fatty-acyl-phospholipid synthase